MNYEITTRPAIQSIRLRSMLTAWAFARGNFPLPALSDLSLDRLNSEFDDIVISDVVKADEAARFLVRQVGKTVQAYLKMDIVGRYLDEAMPEQFRTNTLPIYHYAITHGSPMYATARIADSDGIPVLFERLFLPFSSTRAACDMVALVMKMTSLEGPFESQALITQQPGTAIPASVVAIDPATILRPERGRENDVYFQ